MKKKKKCSIAMPIMLAFSIIISSFSGVMIVSPNKVDATSCTSIVSGSYEMADNVGYYPSKAQSNTMSFNSTSLGILKIDGVNSQGKYCGVDAYSVSETDTPSITYTLKYNKNSINDSSWNLSSDSANSVNGISLNGSSIGKGSVIVEKRNLNDSNYTVLIKTGNVFNSDTSFNYTSLNGDDINCGCYYRISVAYEIYRQYQVKHQFLFIKWTTTETEYKNCLEVYNLFIGKDSCDIQFLDLSEKDYTAYSSDESQIELVKNGDTLQNGSVTSKGFQINYLNNKSYIVTYKRNGEAAKTASDGTQITQNGKYDITVKSLFGNSKTTTIYVYNGGTDQGYATYFGDSIFQGQRVTDLTQAMPTYQKGVIIKLNGVGSNIPSLSGTITNYTTGYTTAINKSTSEQSITLDTEGVYGISLCNGDKELAGTTYNYDFAFIVSDASIAPSINLNNILTTFSISDYDTKHIEVDYTMDSGKIAHICFDKNDYYLAYQLAYMIEKKYIKEQDGVYYYNGLQFTDESLLVEEMNSQVATKLKYEYFTKASDDFYIDEGNLSYSLKLENLNYDKDIYITTVSEYSKLLNRDYILSGNFKFVKVGDYESKTLIAENLETGETVNLSHNKKLSSMLSNSGKYVITETNIYGESVTYTIVYCNTNETNVKLDVDGTEIEINKDNYQIINGTNVKISSVVNNLDTDGVVVVADINSENIKMFDYEDVANFEFESSNYVVSVFDRSGNVFNFIVNTNEFIQTSVEAAVESVKNYNTEIYNYILSLGVTNQTNAYNGN